jgi:hypothetical protein
VPFESPGEVAAVREPPAVSDVRDGPIGYPRVLTQRASRARTHHPRPLGVRMRIVAPSLSGTPGRNDYHPTRSRRGPTSADRARPRTQCAVGVTCEAVQRICQLCGRRAGDLFTMTTARSAGPFPPIAVCEVAGSAPRGGTTSMGGFCRPRLHQNWAPATTCHYR